MSIPLDGNLQTTLQYGQIEMQGQFTRGCNYSFLVRVHHQGFEVLTVYKPSRGEQPLWDFPENTLARRELSAYLFSQALGWNFVPVTVLREDGPFGPGSLQQFIDHDPRVHYFTFTEANRQRLRPVVLFDLLVNNADRKGSHILIENNTNKLWLIDHGLCFHVDDKLRTVIWDFAGEPIPPELLSILENTYRDLSGSSGLRLSLEPYLNPQELHALSSRVAHWLESAVFPAPPSDYRAVPWPPV